MASYSLTVKSFRATLLWGFVVVFLVSLASPGFTYTFEKTLTRTEADSKLAVLQGDSTYTATRTVHFPAEDDLLLFLFRHLEFTGSVARVWNISELTVVKRTDRSFSCRIGESMEGPTYRFVLGNGHVEYIGMGTYRSYYLPITVNGEASIDLQWKDLEQQHGVDMTAELTLRPTNEVLQLISTALYPLVRSQLNGAFEQVIQLGKDLANRLNDKPIETLEKLRAENKSHARLWKQYLKNHPEDPG